VKEARVILIYEYKKYKIIYVFFWKIAGSSIILQQSNNPTNSSSWSSVGALKINNNQAYITVSSQTISTIYYYRLTNGITQTTYKSPDFANIKAQIDNNTTFNSSAEARVIIISGGEIKYVKE
jgi:hypothetical protein